MKYMKFGYLLLIFCILFTGCKSKTMEEEFKKTHKKAGQDILFKDQSGQRPFIIYKAPFDSGNIGAGLAIFKRSEKDGWKLAASNAKTSNGHIMIDTTGVTFEDGIRKYFVYGYINDPQITRIEITDKYNNTLDGHIMGTDWKRVWYGLVEMDELKLKVFNDKNEIVTEVPYKN